MNKKYIKIPLFLMTACLACGFAACGQTEESEGAKKPASSIDFQGAGNYTEPDYKIDGVMDEADWAEAFTVVYGPENEVTFKIIFGETGLTAGWEVIDKKVNGRENPTLESHINEWSDCVEIYLDTQNNGGEMPQSDDYQLNINPFEYARLKVGASGWANWLGIVDYAATINGTPNNDTDEDVGYTVELFLPYSSFAINQDSVIGLALGYRPCNATGERSAWYGWSLSGNPQIPDNYVSIDKNGIYYDAPNGTSTENYIVTKGKASNVTVSETGIDIATGENTWVVDRKTRLPVENKYTLTVDVKNVSVADYQNGIVPYSAIMLGFDKETVSGLEEYYMIWVRNNAAGIAYFSDEGWNWNSKALAQDLSNQEAELKLVRNENVLSLYINGTLHQRLTDESSIQPNGSMIAYRSEVLASSFGFVAVEEGVVENGLTILTQNGDYVIDSDGAYNPQTDYSHALLDEQKLNEDGTGVLSGKMVWKSNADNWSGIILGGTENSPYSSYIFYVTRKTGTVGGIADPIYIGLWKSQDGNQNYNNTGMIDAAKVCVGPSKDTEVDVTIEFTISISVDGATRKFAVDYQVSWGGHEQKSETWTCTDSANSWNGDCIGLYATQAYAVKFYDIKTVSLECDELTVLTGNYMKNPDGGFKPVEDYSKAVLNNTQLNEDGTGVLSGKMVWKSNADNWSGIIFGGTENSPYSSYIFYVTRKTGTVGGIADPIYIGLWKSQDGNQNYNNTGMIDAAKVCVGPSKDTEVDVTIEFTITITVDAGARKFVVDYKVSWGGQVQRTETWTCTDSANSWNGDYIGLYATQAGKVTYYDVIVNKDMNSSD